MQRFKSLVGKRVEASYRAGDIHLSAVGVLVEDSGESISIEERFSQGGKEKMMRVEIPYSRVLQIGEAAS
ncbi:MAG TPA: hypothetical protein VMU43_04690 [Candidatus Acidoferrum sp.]|nr:hypothetical protein [Candidatus Acidoferrum sp.]